MTVVDVRNLTVRYGELTAVNNASFAIEAGQTVALVGANGAGKTSTINAIVGIGSRASGEVAVFGHDPYIDRAEIASRWGVMPQTGGLPMGLRVGECVRLFADLYQRGPQAAPAIEACGLAEVAGRRWRTLSGGQQQRLSLAIALVGGDDLIILDEPTASLDVPGQERVLQVIAERAGQGAAVLLTTHRFDEVEQVADRVVVLDSGAVLANAAISELTRNSPEIRIGGVDGEAANRMNAALGTEFAVSGEDLVSPIAPEADASAALASVLQWCAANDVTTTSASVGSRSLADAYRDLVDE